MAHSGVDMYGGLTVGGEAPHPACARASWDPAEAWYQILVGAQAKTP